LNQSAGNQRQNSSDRENAMKLPITCVKPLIWLLACGATLLICGAAAFVSANQRLGVIKSVNATSIAITTKTGEETFQITAETKISLNDKPAKVTDLKVGDSATITAQGATATAIDTQRAASPRNPDPAGHRVVMKFCSSSY
jgi:hypothetical protein